MDNASELARARSRWKIENATFNMLKNVQHLEHNFGHGIQHLSDTFAALMLLVFLIDQVLEMACSVIKQVFAKCCTRTVAWERLRSSFCAVAFCQLAATVRLRPQALHRARRLRYVLTADRLPSWINPSGRPEAPRRPDGPGTRISVPGIRLNARRHAM